MTTSENDVLDTSAESLETLSTHGIGHWQFDCINETYHASEQACAIRRLSSSEKTALYAQQKWHGRVHYDDRKRVKNALGRLSNGADKNVSIRYRVTLNDTDWRWVLTRASVHQYLADDKPAIIAGVDVDVSELYEELPEVTALQERANLYEMALASAEQGIWHVDLQTGIRTESDTWRTMRGYSLESNYNSQASWELDIHPDDVAKMVDFDCDTDASKSGKVDQTYRQRNFNGNWQWIWSRGKILYDESTNTPIATFGTDIDITAIKETEIRLEQLSNSLDVAMRSAGMGVWEWTLFPQTNIWDKRTREILGVSDEQREVSHEQFLQILHHDDRSEIESILRKAVIERQDIDVEYRIVHPSKGIRYIEAKATYNHSEVETPRYVGIVWDVTDRINAEKERVTLTENLSHAQRLRSIGELTGGIAHDVNNLLAIISGNAELMSMSQKEENKFLTAIVDASQKGAELTQGMLAYSRKSSLKPSMVNVSDIANNLHAMLGRTLGPTIKLRVYIENTPWACFADTEPRV